MYNRVTIFIVPYALDHNSSLISRISFPWQPVLFVVRESESKTKVVSYYVYVVINKKLRFFELFRI